MVGISTASAYNTVLTGMLNAQTAQATATQQISSGETASNLQGYAGQADTLLALQSVQAKTNSYLANSQTTANVLSAQDLAFTQLNGSASTATNAISEALGSGSGDTLMQSLGASFQDAVSALNTNYDGQYLFSGGASNVKPTTSTSLSDLTAPGATITGQFQNGDNVATAQLNSSTTVQTGFLASQLGSNLYTAYQSMESYVQTNGPFTNPLTAAQTTFLQGVLPSFQAANTQLTTAQAQNGLVQQQVTSAQTALTDQQTTLTGLVGNISSADLAKATTNLEQAQTAVQASSQAFLALQNSTNTLMSLLQSAGA
jgi:flagellar hook-associated protein 3 FlgL